MKLTGKSVFYLSSLLPFLILITAGCNKRDSTLPKPNIILILADDMGYSDIESYGGEIHTSNLDRLAAGGLRFTQFYNTARCCPTRASLMTGLAPHQCGMGWMTIRDLGHEGYTGELNRNCLTLAEVLRTAGYSTYMSGKWHLVADRNASRQGNRSGWPLQRGFDKFFGTLLGSGSYYSPASLTSGNEFIEPDPDFFYTDAIVTHAIKFLEEHAKSRKNPFFLYLAFTSPHWPLHTRDSVIDRYMEQYRVGWDSIRSLRYRKMIDLGLLDPGWKMTDRDPKAPAWNSLDPVVRQDMVRRMAVYAAQVDEMDYNIGRLIHFLDEKQELDNTLILFLSDNGGCAEYISSGEDKSTRAIGSPSSYESYRLPWANASNTPFRLYKHWVHEGGISSPLIVHWPEAIKDPGRFVTTPAHIMDIMPTLIDVSRADYPGEYNGYEIQPLEGVSLMPLLMKETLPKRILYWEHEANRAVRKDKWKLVSEGNTEYPFNGEWELYDIENDRTEIVNLAPEHPDIVRELSLLWESWATTHKVYPLDGREWNERLRNPVYNPSDP